MAKRSQTRAGAAASRTSHQSGDIWIVLIGLFKLVKGIVLLVVAVGLLKLVHRDVAAAVTHWVELLRLDPENEHIHRAISRVFRVTPAQLRELSAGTLLYSAMFLTEGVGLLKRKHWAEYLTVERMGHGLEDVHGRTVAGNVAIIPVVVVADDGRGLGVIGAQALANHVLPVVAPDHQMPVAFVAAARMFRAL
jgi:hypothetical protein